MTRCKKPNVGTSPTGFEASKVKKKTHTKDKKDRKIIKMLSKDACSVLNSDLSSSVRSVCNSVIQNYYTKFKIVKVFLRRIVLFLVIFVE